MIRWGLYVEIRKENGNYYIIIGLDVWLRDRHPQSTAASEYFVIVVSIRRTVHGLPNVDLQVKTSDSNSGVVEAGLARVAMFDIRGNRIY